MNAQKDERVVLFVKPVRGMRLDQALVARLKAEITVNLSKRHVPAKFIDCPEIPVSAPVAILDSRAQQLM